MPVYKKVPCDLQLSHYSKFERDVLRKALEDYACVLKKTITSRGADYVNAVDEFYTVDTFLFILRRINEVQNECDD